MNPKINEFYYCKKSVKSILNNKNIFKKGQHYKVIYHHHGEVVLINDIGDMIFSLAKDMIYFYFYEYFGTIKEERKDKLKYIKYEILTQ